MVAGHLSTGKSGEEAAVRYLRKKGYAVLETNWRSGSYELDVICLDQSQLGAKRFTCARKKLGTVVFVEVKTRTSGGRGLPADKLNAKKQARLIKAASAYLSEHELWSRPCRFDFVSVLRTGDAYTVEHYPDAFDFSPALDRSHAPWQPW